jgi:hypothetical protein
MEVIMARQIISHLMAILVEAATIMKIRQLLCLLKANKYPQLPFKTTML